MKEIIRITFRLTLSCFLAALVMGGAFVFTDKAKKDNEHKNVQTTMLGLLGYSIEKPAPKELKLSLFTAIFLKKREQPISATWSPSVSPVRKVMNF